MKTHKTRLSRNKQDLRANGSILPLALRPGLPAKSNLSRLFPQFHPFQLFSYKPLVPRIFTIFSLMIFGPLFINTFNNPSASASSVTLTIPSSALSLDIKPNSGTIFQKSSAGTISIKTDSSYGYSLSIHSKNSDGDGTKSNDLLNGSNKIASIISPLSASDFQNSGDSNTWGYLPSKLNSSTNNDFQPGPTSDPTTLDVTDSSSEGTNYDITLATKIDSTLPSGTYHNTFVLTAVSNDPAYDDIMQNWSGCDDLPEETKTLNLLDTRDSKIYTVAKLKDGKCWMTQNLEIENYKLTTADSDVAGDFTLNASVDRPNSGNSYTSTDIHVDDTYGGYYTWYTATAGDGTQSVSTDGQNVAHSVCPKGWRLPTRDEFIALDNAFGGTGNNSQSSSTSVGGGKTLLQMYQDKDGANFLMGGSYYDGSSSNVGTKAYYWSSTAKSERIAYVLSFDSSFVNPQGQGINKNDLRSVRCVSRSSDPTMQNVEEWADSVETDQTVSATDTRDGKTYTVARLANGQLWMTQNLALGDDALQNRTLTSENTDISSNFTMPTSSTSGFSSSSAENVYVDPTYGGYYTYNAATAGTGNSISSYGEEAPGSICPKGWRLPTMTEYLDLATVYGGDNSTGSNNLQNGTPKFVYSGNYSSGSSNYQGSNGYYWSSATYGSSDAYYFYLSSSNAYIRRNARYYGFAVRCIARIDEPREPININDTLQNVENWGDNVQDTIQPVIVKDSRDNKEYTVARLKDGHLWVTQNLALGDSSLQNRTLTSTDSDLPDGRSWTVPTSSTSGFRSSSAENIYVGSTYGGYYTYNAATAGTGNSILRDEAAGSVCPKGWRLPTMTEYLDLATAYGGNSSTGSTNLRIGTPAFVYSGIYLNSSPSSQGSSGHYWPSTANNKDSACSFRLDSSNATGGGGTDRRYGFAVRCIARTDDPIGTMQNVSEWADSVEEDQTVRATDTRDNKTYTVARLADNKLWMTQNLAIASKTLTSTDSDVSSNFNLPASSTGGFSDFNISNVYVDSIYGGYYTWYAATAGEGTSNKSNGDTSHSICPKGWRLPTKAEYDTLVSSQGASNMTGSPANFQLAGYYSNSSLSNQDLYGNYWTSTAFATASVWNLSVYSGGAYTGDSNKLEGASGYSVRCISRQ